MSVDKRPVNVYFNPRTPCGVRREDSVTMKLSEIFQSTHPLRGATGTLQSGTVGEGISIHAPLAGCDETVTYEKARLYISIHAPLAGCDKRQDKYGAAKRDFNPRTPCGVRHVGLRAGHQHGHFNPRTPCGVRPPISFACAATMLYFNPRTPCGVRQAAVHRNLLPLVFQSTHPLRGATLILPTRLHQLRFQSTHPLRGATCWARSI